MGPSCWRLPHHSPLGMESCCVFPQGGNELWVGGGGGDETSVSIVGVCRAESCKGGGISHEHSLTSTATPRQRQSPGGRRGCMCQVQSQQCWRGEAPVLGIYSAAIAMVPTHSSSTPAPLLRSGKEIPSLAIQCTGPDTLLLSDSQCSQQVVLQSTQQKKTCGWGFSLDLLPCFTRWLDRSIETLEARTHTLSVYVNSTLHITLGRTQDTSPCLSSLEQPCLAHIGFVQTKD